MACENSTALLQSAITIARSSVALDGKDWLGEATNNSEDLFETPNEFIYENKGKGKCLQNGKDIDSPNHQFIINISNRKCKSLCDKNQSCSGFSWSNLTRDCLLWLPTLTAGGIEWGKCNCYVKQDNNYVNLGAGKCLDNGKGPKYDAWENIPKASCKQKCDRSQKYRGYSWSNKNRCLLWLQPTLTSGGHKWGGASCFVKERSRPGDSFNG